MAECNDSTEQLNEDMMDLATSPLISKTAEGMVQERTAKDMIDMANYQAGVKAGDKPAYGIRMARVRCGGTVN